MVVTAKVGERVELMTSEPNAECECAVISINFKGNQIAVTVSDNPSKPILFSVARQIVHPQPEENVVTAKVNPVYRG
ncbi:predicted protein [Sclerotinia sclerotiorum 1980 UF-70]|uniref:Uncharacterized protein n=2 Tax=Sclerotinia sclerotiorum (strain ATCC 18683 / 1980 / Ss-1) TaxID=665079 RepID=A0A1D9PVE3_SCLS1|nr:predicted protein [Sclerotinia sclerotiorum 1980 UF-70]APA06688.1 hypothetical protein sscle_02g014580 [Sclerotinia sclerotiorum 1980 UF-70]EDO02251.1 predicted protein [Sclerotinia sclerotiorum 1980 UF-70]